MRNDRERLLDIVEAIEHIERKAADGKAAYEFDEMIQTWIVRHIAVIGEAAAQLSQEVRAKNPSIPWSGIIGMRNILVHAYHRIDLDEVWRVVESDLPVLKKRIEAILQELPADGD